MKKTPSLVCVPALIVALSLDPRGAAAQADGGLADRSAALERREAEVERMEKAAERKAVERETALTSFVQLLGDARAQTTTSGESSAAFGGGILYRGENQSILIVARSEARTDALDTQTERGAFMLTPEATGRPSFEFDWRVYFFCMTEAFDWRARACADPRGPPGRKREGRSGGAAVGGGVQTGPNDVDFGIRLYMSGGTADWSIPASGPMDDETARRAGVLSYGADLALRREFIKGQDNYVGLEAGVGLTARNLIGDLTADENSAELEAFLGTDRVFYMGPEVYIALTINALNVGISLPIIPYGEVDGLSGGQLLVTAIVRDGPKLVIPD